MTSQEFKINGRQLSAEQSRAVAYSEKIEQIFTVYNAYLEQSLHDGQANPDGSVCTQNLFFTQVNAKYGEEGVAVVDSISDREPLPSGSIEEVAYIEHAQYLESVMRLAGELFSRRPDIDISNCGNMGLYSAEECDFLERHGGLDIVRQYLNSYKRIPEESQMDELHYQELLDRFSKVPNRPTSVTPVVRKLGKERVILSAQQDLMLVREVLGRVNHDIDFNLLGKLFRVNATHDKKVQYLRDLFERRSIEYQTTISLRAQRQVTGNTEPFDQDGLMELSDLQPSEIIATSLIKSYLAVLQSEYYLRRTDDSRSWEMAKNVINGFMSSRFTPLE